MEEKLNGIVLGAVPYGENDKIINVFTLEKGKISARAKGVKKAGAKLKFATEPFCFVEYVFLKTGDKRRVKTASIIDSFYPLRESVERYFCAATIVEFVRKFFKADMVSPQAFMLVVESLKSLAYGENTPKYYLLDFFIKALAETGYGINSFACASCGQEITKKPFFDYYEGGFFCEDCKKDTSREINFLTFDAINKVARGEKVLESGANLGLRLIDFYLSNKMEENITSLKELLKLDC